MSEIADRIIGNGKLTATARVGMIIFSIVGSAAAPFVLDEIVQLNQTLARIDTHLAVQDERSKAQDHRLDAIEATNKAEDAALQDHSGRIIRLETRAGLAPAATPYP
jgi:hypothetical protein